MVIKYNDCIKLYNYKINLKIKIHRFINNNLK